MGCYGLPIASLASLTTTPFAQLSTPATVSIEILCIELGQEASETSEQLQITAARRSTASTLPTSTTPLAARESDGASLLTGSTTTNATGIATVTGTLTSTFQLPPFNALNGFYWEPIPERRWTVKPSGFLTLQFKAAPAAGTWSGMIWFDET